MQAIIVGWAVTRLNTGAVASGTLTAATAGLQLPLNTTLLGYHKQVACQQCNHPFLVNFSSWADPQDGQRVPVEGCTCQNCGFPNLLRPQGGRP